MPDSEELKDGDGKMNGAHAIEQRRQMQLRTIQRLHWKRALGPDDTSRSGTKLALYTSIPSLS